MLLHNQLHIVAKQIKGKIDIWEKTSFRCAIGCVWGVGGWGGWEVIKFLEKTLLVSIYQVVFQSLSSIRHTPLPLPLQSHRRAGLSSVLIFQQKVSVAEREIIIGRSKFTCFKKIVEGILSNFAYPYQFLRLHSLASFFANVSKICVQYFLAQQRKPNKSKKSSRRIYRI